MQFHNTQSHNTTHTFRKRVDAELHLREISASEFPANAIETYPFAKRDLLKYAVVVGQILRKSLERCQFLL